MARRERPGLPQVAQLQQPIRLVLEPVIDLLARVLGLSGIGKLKTLPEFVTADTGLVLVAGVSTLNDTIAQVNILKTAVEELQDKHNTLQLKVNEIITRLQED